MEHVYWVWDDLLAGRPGPTRVPWNAQALYAGGIRAVVSLAQEVQVEDLTTYGILHYRGEFPPLSFYSEGMRKAFIYMALPVWRFIDTQVKAGKPTLVHCFAGQDRTGVILSGYLVIYQGLSRKKPLPRSGRQIHWSCARKGMKQTVHLLSPNQLPDPRTLL